MENQKRTPEVIMIGTEKGGTGKSATALTLCETLSYCCGYKVLLLDCDSSGGATAAIMKERPENCLYDLFVGNCSINEVIYHLDHFDIIPTTKDDESESENTFQLIDRKNLSDLFERSEKNGRNQNMDFKMKMLLDILKNNFDYDFYIIDTPPVACSIVNNVINASDSILIPCQPNSLSVSGLSMLLSTCSYQQKAHPDTYHTSIDGVVFTMYTNAWKDRQKYYDAITQLISSSGIYMYNSKYRLASAIETSMNQQEPISNYINSGSGFADSLNFALEFLHKRGLAPRKEFPKVQRLEDGRWFYGDTETAKASTSSCSPKYYFFFTQVGSKAICERKRFSRSLLDDSDFTSKLNTDYFLNKEALTNHLTKLGLVLAEENEIPYLRRKKRRAEKKAAARSAKSN